MNKKHAFLNNHLLGKTLGDGAYAKVKLASHNNKQVAAKIFMKKDDLKSNLEILNKETEIMKKLNHPNIVNIIEIITNGTYTKKNGKQYQTVGILLEYCAAGCLFDFVAQCGSFTEEISRAYFHQLIDALEYLQNNNISHRDLKPENLLLDHEFNLKVADFGFSTLLQGKDGNGFLNTQLGTEGYQAPEIYENEPYNGASVDLFAAGVILFIMYSGLPPFTKAHPRDSYYKLIYTNNYETFWQQHNKSKKPGYYSEDFMSLINSLLAHKDIHRPSLAEIKCHPWYNGPVTSMGDIRNQFLIRYNTVQASIEKDRLAKQEQKLQEKNNKGQINLLTGTTKFRSSDEDKSDEFADINQSFNLLSVKRQLREAEEGDDTISSLKTIVDAEYLFKQLLKKHQDFSQKAEPSDKYYKIKFTQTDSNSCTLIFTIEIKKIDEEVNVLDFQKVQGQTLVYYNVVNQIKEQISSLSVY